MPENDLKIDLPPIEAGNGEFTDYWALYACRSDGSAWGIKPKQIPAARDTAVCFEHLVRILDALLHEPRNRAYLEEHGFIVVDR